MLPLPVSVKHAIKHPVTTYATWRWNRRGMPGQTPREIALFKELLLRSGGDRVRVFEYGAGNSTIHYAAFLRGAGRRFEWRAVDNSRAWQQRVEQRLVREGLAGQVTVACHEFPAWWELDGFSLQRPACFASYADPAPLEAYIREPARDPEPFDVIIVDGRFRRRCLHAARALVAPRGVVILHDAQRVHYHEPLARYPHQAMLPTEHLHGSKDRLNLWFGSPENDALVSHLVRYWRERLAEAR